MQPVRSKSLRLALQDAVHALVRLTPDAMEAAEASLACALLLAADPARAAELKDQVAAIDLCRELTIGASRFWERKRCCAASGAVPPVEPTLLKENLYA